MASKKRHVSITGIFIAGMVLLTVVFAFATYYQRNPLARKWNYAGRFAVLDSDTYTVTSYPSDKSSIITVKIPQDIYILVPEGYGYYRLEDVRELSRSEKRGDELLINAISNLLGIPIEATSRTLSYWDQYAIWKLENKSELMRKSIDLSRYPITVTDTRSDGSTITRFDGLKILLYFEDTFWERPIRDEQYTVGIYNAAGQPGLASTVSRMLETVGYRVVEISNWDTLEDIAECRIQFRPVEELRDSASIHRLKQMTGCRLYETEDINQRTDIQLIITRAI